MTDVDKRIATAKRKAVRDRNYRRARDRALVRLTHAYPETYKQLLEQEKASDKEQGKIWLDIDGTTDLSIGIHTRVRGEAGSDSAHSDLNQSQDKGDDL